MLQQVAAEADNLRSGPKQWAVLSPSLQILFGSEALDHPRPVRPRDSGMDSVQAPLFRWDIRLSR